LFSANLNRGSDDLSAEAATNVLSALCPKFPFFLIERYVVEETKSGSGIFLKCTLLLGRSR